MTPSDGGQHDGECGLNRIVIGKILNHAEPGVTAVYDRHSYDAEKRQALDERARTLTAILQRRT